VVLIGGVTNLVVPGFTLCHVDFISFALPPALVVVETDQLFTMPVPLPCCDQHAGKEVLLKFSDNGKITVPHRVVKVRLFP
jgi:hypothetical protein